MNLVLKEKRAIVCGSNQGIGKEIAIGLAQLGCSVTLVARNEEKLVQARRELEARNVQRHEYLIADFEDPESLRTTINEYLAKIKQVHILVNNTGGPSGGPIAEARVEEFEKTFAKHLICNHILVQAVLPYMREGGYGRIINVISTSVKQPLPNLGVSNTVRAAVANWAKTLANELAPEGITVNNVLPGATRTGRLESLIQARAEKTGRTIEEIEAEMLKEIPMGRFAKPEEIANAAVFLASPAAAYITGTNITVDGGRTGTY